MDSRYARNAVVNNAITVLKSKIIYAGVVGMNLKNYK